MELRVIRENFKAGCTIGRLLIDGRFECFTLEDGIRRHKVDGATAIPVGRYAVTVTHSPRFKCRLPLLANVPKFSGVRIHPGNSAADTAGCILVGQTCDGARERIAGSRRAFDALLPKIEAALQAGEPVELAIEQVNAPIELSVRAVRRGAVKPAAKTSKRAAGRKAAARRPQRGPRSAAARKSRKSG
jgi:hypothetical protein